MTDKMNFLLRKASLIPCETKMHGNHDENGTHLFLKAGLLSMEYKNGNIRYISAGNREIIRMIYSAVRDKEWLNVPREISDEEFDLHSDSFMIKYRCRYRSGVIDFSSHLKIEGNADSSLTFSFEGEALTSFEKNRIGLCILHPVEGITGQKCLISHINGDNEISEFPVFISPHQLFKDIKSLKWSISDLNCTLDFSGDVFETEDQRNWTDASFKTYSTPLSLPFPVKLYKGEKVCQNIELKVEGDTQQVEDNNNEIVITIDPEKTFKLPGIGIGRSTRPFPLTGSEIQILRKLRFDHYRIDLYLFNEEWKDIAETAVNEAALMGYPVEFALFFDDNHVKQSSEFISWISGKQIETACINLFHRTVKSTPDKLSDALIPQFKIALPKVNIGCGTNSDFAQLNRSRPETLLNDTICYSVHPQEHASDNITLIENLKAQTYTAECAGQFAKGREIWISPVNIKRRFNAAITNFELPSSGAAFPSQADSRLMSLFGACWTAGSLKYLCESGIKGVTYLETAGERGIMQGDFPSRWPENFRSFKGMIFPVYHIFYFLLKCKSFSVIKSLGSHPLAIESLVLANGKSAKLIVINFTAQHHKAVIEGFNELISMCQLNSYTFADAAIDPCWVENAEKILITYDTNLVFEPYSVSFIEGRI
jgi:D-apionolactonase